VIFHTIKPVFVGRFINKNVGDAAPTMLGKVIFAVLP